MLAFTPRRAILPTALILCTIASISSRLPVRDDLVEICFLGCWASVIAIAVSVHLPRGVPFWLALIGSVIAGCWAGLVVAANGQSIDLMRALPCVLLAVPGHLIRRRGWGIALKVLSSWLIAVALLVALLPLAHTPGYVPDHMD